MQEAPGCRPAGRVVARWPFAAGLARDHEAPCELAFASPFEEITGVGCARRPLGQPVIDVALGAGGQLALACGQESHEGDRGVQVHLCVAGGGAWRPGTSGPLTGLAQYAPSGVGAKEPALVFALDAGQSFANLGLEAGQGVVAGDEHAVGDQ